MKDNFKIAILGGTGKSGRYLVSQLLSKGHHLKLLLRNPENYLDKNQLVELVQGDVRNYESVHLWLEGCQAVISALGQPKGEPSIFSQASRNIVQAMKHFGIERYIVITGLSVDTPSDKKGNRTKLATDWMNANYPETTLDKQVEYQVLCGCKMNWTMVRLPKIEQTDESSKVLVGLEDCPGDRISSIDLACFLIEQLSDSTYARKAPFVANV